MGSNVISINARNGELGALIAHVERAPAGVRCFCGCSRVVTMVEVTSGLDTYSVTRCALCGAVQGQDGAFYPANGLDVPICLWPVVGE
jgi:hypothetical protein